MADLKITELPELQEADLNAVDELAIADRSASETRRINSKSLLEGAFQFVDDGSLPGGKIEPDSITNIEIAPDAITDSELADGSVDTDAIQDGAVTDDKLADGIDGAKLIDDSVTADKIDPASLDRGIDKTTGAIGHTNEVVPLTRSGITYDAQGHITGSAALTGDDLPIATTTTIGGVSVPTSSGLTVSGFGALDHQTSIAAGTTSGITYDDHGHIAAITPLAGTDLPPATDTDLGGVIVPGGDGLEVDADGVLTHADSGVVPDTYPKVTVDANGHVTDGQPLAQADIPPLDGSILTTGTIDPARIADKSIQRPKLADYCISYIQEGQPSLADTLHIGCLWYQESSAQLRMWNGNSWMPVGFGRLSNENLRFCGTFDAAADNILQVTTLGTAAGLEPNTQLPPATNPLTGAYLVISTPGTYDGTVYDNGDWILCLGATDGWVRIDTMNGGGGGGATNLDDLLDVNINNPQAGDLLVYDPNTNQWVNQNATSEKATFVEAIDGARTSFEMSRDATDVNNIMLSVGGVIQEPGVDFAFAAPRAINFASPPPAGSEYFIIIEGTLSSGGGGGGGTNLPDGTAAEEYLKWDSTLGSWVAASTLDGGTY